MPRKLHIAREDIELGCLTDDEARELLCAGFLLPTDVYWTEDTADWKPLSELESESKSKRGAGVLLSMAKQKVVAAGETAASQAARLTGKLTSAAKQGGVQVSKSTNRLLDAFIPQIQKLVSRQLVKSSVTRVQTAIHDDAFMRKIFGATYDCLPKPVCRFVSEEAFIKYCMERRQMLLGVKPTDKKSE